MLFNPKQDPIMAEMALSAPVQRPALWPSFSPLLGQIIRFFLVGILNTTVDACVYFLLTRWVWVLPAARPLAKGISYTTGIVNSFFWNKTWTFKSRVDTRRAFFPFVIVNLLAIGLNSGVMHLALASLGLPELGALVLATGVTFLWNFVTSKFLIYK